MPFDDGDSDVSQDLQEVNKLQRQDSDDDEEEYARKIPFTEKPMFNAIIGLVIVINAITLGVELEVEGMPEENAGPTPISERLHWYILHFTFCLIFFVELILRLYCLGIRYFFVPSNLLDFAVVILAVADTWVLPLLNIDGDLAIFSVFRMLRMLKLIRLIRLVQMFKELWLIVVGLRESLKTLGWVCLLLVLFIYMCGIFLTTQVGHNDLDFDQHFRETQGWDHEVYFGTVARSMLTLMQVLTRDGWSDDIARHVIKIYPAMSWFFILFVTFATYGLLSVIVGVIVESTLAEAKHNDDKIKKKSDSDRSRVLDHLKTVFALADEDKSGTITMAEVREAVKNPEIAKKLQLIGFPVSDPNKIFMLLDVDQSGELTIEEFINGCMRLKGDAKSKDLLMVQVGVEQLARHLALLDEKSQLAQDKIGILDRKTQKMAKQTRDMFASERTRKKWAK